MYDKAACAADQFDFLALHRGSWIAFVKREEVEIKTHFSTPKKKEIVL